MKITPKSLMETYKLQVISSCIAMKNANLKGPFDG